MRLLPNSGGTNIWKIPANGGTAIQLTPGGGNEGHPEWLGPAAAAPPAAYLYGRCANGACDLMTVAENGAYAKVIFSDGALNVETAVSPNGQRMIWRAGDQIVVANIDGTGRTRLTTCGYNSDPSWSPDGQRIAYHSNCDGGDDVWIMNADGSNQTRSMNGPTTNGTPFWSPDGQWIAFSTNRTGPNDIWIVRPDGTDARPINSDPTLDTYPAWSPDSQQLVWTCGQSLCLGNINAVGAIPIPNTGPFAENAYWGSDGLISFTRLAENGFNVWTIRPDGTGLRRLTLDNIGANHPLRLPYYLAW